MTGHRLEADTPYSIAAPGERWPVVDGIAYLRVGREALAALALGHLDAGRPADALIVLLSDQDDWWTGPATDPTELTRLVRDRDTLSLRAAMALLRMGPVADYFAYRWVDPTYLAGLALVQSHWRRPASTFELACGIGHYLRELAQHGVACTGADVVFAKCWLARHWVAPRAAYVVFDAGAAWPIEECFDLVMCHDAFYFLPDQPRAAERLRGLLAEGGVLTVSHLHNARYRGGAHGPAHPAATWRAIFPEAAVYDERALLDSLLNADTASQLGWTDHPDVEAYSLAERAGAPEPIKGGVALPHPGATLRLNPLLVQGVPQWPSDRWRDEYGPGCRWALPDSEHGRAPDPVRIRRLVDLPERW